MRYHFIVHNISDRASDLTPMETWTASGLLAWRHNMVMDKLFWPLTCLSAGEGKCDSCIQEGKNMAEIEGDKVAGTTGGTPPIHHVRRDECRSPFVTGDIALFWSLRRQGFTPCTANRRGENESLAGGARRKILLQENGSRSCPGWLLTPDGAAETFSESCSASPQDAISPCKSVHFSVGWARSELISWKPLENNGRRK